MAGPPATGKLHGGGELYDARADAEVAGFSEARLARRWLSLAAKQWRHRALPAMPAAATFEQERLRLSALTAAELKACEQKCKAELVELVAACTVAEARLDRATSGSRPAPAAPVVGIAAASPCRRLTGQAAADRSADLSTDIAAVQTQSAALRARLLQLRRQSAEAAERNRVAARRLAVCQAHAKESHLQMAEGDDEQQQLLAAARARDMRAEKVRVVTSVLRGLVFACRLDWAADERLKAAVLDLN